MERNHNYVTLNEKEHRFTRTMTHTLWCIPIIKSPSNMLFINLSLLISYQNSKLNKFIVLRGNKIISHIQHELVCFQSKQQPAQTNLRGWNFYFSAASSWGIHLSKKSGQAFSVTTLYPIVSRNIKKIEKPSTSIFNS